MKPIAEKPGSKRNDISSGIVQRLAQTTETPADADASRSVASSTLAGKARKNHPPTTLRRKSGDAGFPSGVAWKQERVAASRFGGNLGQ
jgi:hypothetical protein